MEPSNWFKGTEKSIVQLSQEQQAAFFLECDKNCVNSSTLTIYRKLYEDANEDMDAFFQMANELPRVKGESLKRPCLSSYLLGMHLQFVQERYVTTPLLCKRLRQSDIYSMQSL